jgi:threonine synthase
MRLVSTRGASEAVGFGEAVRRGAPADGGLYTPERLAPFADIDALFALPWRDRCAEILARLLGDELDPGETDALSAEAFDFPVPLVAVERDVFALELFHGPSLAFKDFGARFLAGVLALLHRRGRLAPVTTILVATSGDTGAAVANAFWRRPGFRVVVLYPRGRVSALQERQFASLGDNVESLAVEGGFDDCQALAKACLADPALALECRLTSANSINVARLLAQVLYYFEAVARLRAAGARRAPTISVPSGNFGNLCAGLIARALGLPVTAFVAATNANRTVPDYLETGVYRPRAGVATLSSAMDVGAPSNWERIESMFDGRIEALRTVLRWASVDDERTRNTLRDLHALGYLADPHSAVAYRALRDRLGSGETGVFLATAHPAKFRDILEPLLGASLPLPPVLSEALERPLRARSFPDDAQALKAHLRGAIRA